MKKTDSPKPAKLCYDHIGGKLGTLLLHHFIEKEWIAKVQTEDKHYIITPEGEKGFKKMGIDLSDIQ
jgi:hypothetical protein